MERKTGEIFEYNGEWYQCIVEKGCKNCAFNERKCYTFTGNNDPIGDCCADIRTDKYSVIFKKLEKVGDPYVGDNGIFQSYKLAMPIYGDIPDQIIGFTTTEVVIKQNKEDMEENGNNRTNCAQCGDKRFEVIARAKAHLLEATNIASDEKEMAVIDNILFRFYQMGWLERYEEETKELDLMPFDIQKAREGKPVCTRDGRKARIICFDKKKDIYPLIALVTDKDGYEIITLYKADGVHPTIPNDDLMMLPEKKEGWVNIYNRYGADLTSDGHFFFTKEEALSNIENDGTYVKTIKMSWEE